MADAFDFSCPRCDRSVTDAYYGPCADCRQELVSAASGRARKVERTAYEPKMNVVANQVATRD